MVMVTQFLNRISYPSALQKMLALKEQRLLGLGEDTFLFLEHDPVITSGKRDSKSDLKVSTEFLHEKGIEFVETDRGGRLTYHGPGQLVIYFVVDLEKRRLKISDLVYRAEEGMLLVLKDYGIKVARDCKNPGLWVGDNKIASIGFHVERGVSYHGASLNVSCDLEPYNFFIPCGLPERGATSILKETGHAPDLQVISKCLASLYSSQFS